MNSDNFLTDPAAYWYWNGPYLISAQYNTCLTQNAVRETEGNVILSPIGTSPFGRSCQMWNPMDTYKITTCAGHGQFNGKGGTDDLLMMWNAKVTVYEWLGGRPNSMNSRWYKY
jgi:hypothetical protein